MTGEERILRALNDAADEMVEQAGYRRHSMIARIAALAACAALLAVSFHPFLRGMRQSGGDAPAQRILLEEDGGASYEIWEDVNNWATDRFDLPWPITGQMAGELVCALPGDGGTVYEYAPLAGRTGEGPAAVRLLKEGDDWRYLLFVGFSHPEAEALLQVYGIRTAEDIAGVTAGNAALDPERFYAALAGVSGVAGEECDRLVTAGADSSEGEGELLEEGRQEIVRLKLTTDLGIVAWPEYCPAAGYLSWGEMCYPIGTDLLG